MLARLWAVRVALLGLWKGRGQARSKFRIVVTLLYHSVMARIKFSHNFCVGGCLVLVKSESEGVAMPIMLKQRRSEVRFG